MVRAHTSLAALQAGWQDVRQGELVFDLIDSLHVAHDLERFKVDQTLAECLLLLVWGVGNLPCEAAIDPQVDEVCAQCCQEDASDNSCGHTVLFRSRHATACKDSPDR